MARRLGVLAGEGDLVGEVVAAALAAGDAVRIIALETPPDLKGVEIVRASLADPAQAFLRLAEFRATHVTLVGKVGLDGATRRGLAVAAGGDQRLGDVDLATSVRDMLERHGLVVLGPHEIAPDLLAPEGWIAGPACDAARLAAARFALSMAREIGRLDLGQAVVASATRLIAAEDIAGTDALLDRVATYRLAGLLPAGGEALLLAKAMKPQQPAYVDLPAIGVEAVGRAAAAGISTLVVEAGRTLLLRRAALAAAAEGAGISIIGLGIDG